MNLQKDNALAKIYRIVGGTRLIFVAWTIAALIVFQGILYGMAGVNSLVGYSLPPLEEPVLLLAYFVWTVLWTVFYEFAKTGIQGKAGVWTARFLLGASLAGWFAFNITLTFRPLL